MIGRLGLTFGVVAGTLATAGMARIALAADLAVKAAPSVLAPVKAVDWTGLYAGGDVGVLFNGARFNQPTIAPSDTSLGLTDPRPTYGAYAGFNYQLLPWMVVGIEADYSKFSAANYLFIGSNLATSDTLESASHMQAITGRLGFVLWPDTMVYGRAGPAEIKVQYFKGFDVFTTPTTLHGVQTAVGIESLVTPNIAVRGEASYTYADQLLSVNSNTAIYRPGFMQYELGLAYKFDPLLGLGTPASAPVQSVAAAPNWHFWDWLSPQPAPVATTKTVMATKAPPPAAATASSTPSVPNWTGFEAGGFISGNGNELTYIDTDPAVGTKGPFTDFTIGGGWFVGANYQYDHVVIGAEFSGNYESANFMDPAGSGGTPPDFHIANLDRVLALTGRIGWLATPATLFYVKAGPAWMKMTPDFNYWNGFMTPNNSTAPATFNGMQEGVGVETFIWRNVSAKAEVVYTRTGHQLSFQGGLSPDQFTIRPSILSALLGLALHI